MNPQSKEAVYEEALLQYFNHILLEKGLITQQSYEAMEKKIRTCGWQLPGFWN